MRETLFGHNTNELSLNWAEVDGFNRSNHGSDQAILSSLIKEFSVIGVLKLEAGQSASS
jgi:hypothetical protein